MAFFVRAALCDSGWVSDVRLELIDGCFSRIECGAQTRAGDVQINCAIPGMVNLHSHAFQRAMAGKAEVAGAAHDNFWTWREAMYAVAHRIQPNEYEATAFEAFCAMLEAGFTHTAEFHYLHRAPDGTMYDDCAEMCWPLVRAAARAGIGLTILPAFYGASGFGGATLSESQRRFGLSIDDYAALYFRLKTASQHNKAFDVGLCVHSLRAATLEQVRQVVRLDTNAPIHLHIAEQVAEVEACIAFSNRRPIEFLMSGIDLDQRWCLVHATHASPDELIAIAKSGAVVGLCPITEANLGDGVFSALTYLQAGGRFGVGTDSNVQISMLEELRLLEYGQRLFNQKRNVLASAGARTADTLVQGALLGGAQAVGKTRWGFSVGAVADIVSLNCEDLAVPEEALSRAMFAPGRGNGVDRVWRGGKLVVEGGRHVLQ